MFSRSLHWVCVCACVPGECSLLWEWFCFYLFFICVTKENLNWNSPNLNSISFPLHFVFLSLWNDHCYVYYYYYFHSNEETDWNIPKHDFTFHECMFRFVSIVEWSMSWSKLGGPSSAVELRNMHSFRFVGWQIRHSLFMPQKLFRNGGIDFRCQFYSNGGIGGRFSLNIHICGWVELAYCEWRWMGRNGTELMGRRNSIIASSANSIDDNIAQHSHTTK